jgi:hypothetical protein
MKKFLNYLKVPLTWKVKNQDIHRGFKPLIFPKLGNLLEFPKFGNFPV